MGAAKTGHVLARDRMIAAFRPHRVPFESSAGHREGAREQVWSSLRFRKRTPAASAKLVAQRPWFYE